MALPKPMKKAVAKKAMKGMKSMKAMKAKRQSKVAKGRLARAMVLRGRKEKTSGGLTKDSLIKNKRGKVVSKRASAAGRKRFAFIEGWLQCVNEAREKLHIKGFTAINGKSTAGKALYAKSKALYTELKTGAAKEVEASTEN
eukprot:TRINITY_DN47274_c0_g1_i1.p1 TRINITY_DN47274_c0_g1~~TRINITY_DN47274_c0_g1_i1.p1  ORF type:complete len:161 (-),score=48.51 TRINITY_DN47274_c0_g1_i1:146-571(-)